jgi:hypothetical protein
MRTSLLIAVGVLLLLSSCALVSDKPLLSPRYAVRDARLEGLWRSDTEQGPAYFYVAYGTTARGSVLFFGKDKNGLSTASWDFFVIRTAKHAYLNMDIASAKETGLSANRENVRDPPRNGYFFMEYHFSWSGQLVISDVGGESFSRAVQEGKLHGKADLFLTTIQHETPGRLLAFIEAAKPEDVFHKLWIAKKIGTP